VGMRKGIREEKWISLAATKNPSSFFETAEGEERKGKGKEHDIGSTERVGRKGEGRGRWSKSSSLLLYIFSGRRQRKKKGKKGKVEGKE